MTRPVLCPKCGEPLGFRQRIVERRSDGLYQHAFCAPDMVVRHPREGGCGCFVPGGLLLVVVGLAFMVLVGMGVGR